MLQDKDVVSAAHRVASLIVELVQALELSSEDSEEFPALGMIPKNLTRLFGSDSFRRVFNRSEPEQKQNVASAVDEIINFLHHENRVDRHIRFRETLTSQLKVLVAALLQLDDAEEGLSPNTVGNFRNKVVSLMKAVDTYEDAEPYSTTVRMKRRMEQNTSNANLLRAKLDTSQTELKIREERARAAEMRAQQLASELEQLHASIAALEAKVIDYSATEAHLKNLVSKANAEKSEITAIRDQAQTLAADAADNVMARSYGAMAKNHAKKERLFRWTAFLFFIASTIGAFLIAWNINWLDAPAVAYSSPSDFWSGAARKLLVAGGLAGIGFYFSRLASHHRKIEVWSSSLGVQLRTLESYLGGIKGDDVKDTIREKFAALTFGGPPELNSSTANTKVPDAKAMTELATALTTALRQ